MMLTLQRTRADGARTFGELLLGDRHLCHTLEDALREVPGEPVEAWKVHGATAIPAGVYRLTLEQSPRFGPDTLTVHGVPGFTAIRMHAGNTEADTEGCPLLGMRVDGRGIVAGTSRPAVDLMRTLVRQARDEAIPVLLEVRNPGPAAPRSERSAAMILIDAVLHNAIRPALDLLPAGMDTRAAHVMLLAAGLQESRLLNRAQKTSDPYVKGPARGLWQFERGGAVLHVLTHHTTARLAREVCKACGVLPDQVAVHERLEFDDVLAACFARLLLWSDPHPLPPVLADHETAWQCYLRCWRPGKPHRDTWDEFHAQAVAQVI